jgi:hypothetical protein
LPPVTMHCLVADFDRVLEICQQLGVVPEIGSHLLTSLPKTWAKLWSMVM